MLVYCCRLIQMAMWYVFREVRVVSEVSKAWVGQKVSDQAQSDIAGRGKRVSESHNWVSCSCHPCQRARKNATDRFGQRHKWFTQTAASPGAVSTYSSFTPRRRSPRGIGALFSAATGHRRLCLGKVFWVSYFVWIVFFWRWNTL